MNNDTTSATSAIKKKAYDPDNPDSVADFWEGARIEHKGKIIGTARKPGERGPQKKPTKVQVTIRLSPEVIDYFKDTGKGWQTRMDEALREYVQAHHC